MNKCDEWLEARAELGRLLEQSLVGVLATLDGESTHTSLVGFAVFDEGRALVFATPRSTRKYANLKAYCGISLLIDDRRRVAEDFAAASAVTVRGRAREPAEDERGRVRDAYLARHPQLESFVRSPSCALILLEVERYLLVRRFQDVLEILPG